MTNSTTCMTRILSYSLLTAAAMLISSAELAMAQYSIYSGRGATVQGDYMRGQASLIVARAIYSREQAEAVLAFQRALHLRLDRAFSERREQRASVTVNHQEPRVESVHWPRILQTNEFQAERQGFERLLNSEPEHREEWIRWGEQIDQLTRLVLAKLESRRGKRSSYAEKTAAQFVIQLARSTVFGEIVK